MTSKQAIVAELGDQQILAPEIIARSLVANDQVKYYFALLQAARSNADHPQVPAISLRAERLACRLADAWLDDVVGGAAKGRTRSYRIPHAPEIIRRITAAVEAMLECLPATDRAPFLERAANLELPVLEHGAIAGETIATMTSGNRKAGDSLHLVVMDAHRAINKLQAATAVETLAGARVHTLSARGRTRVEAFMRGLNRTAPLKFDHPGLGTTATEFDDQLLIQNDIGTTDAHVLVVRVTDFSTVITYTDIHRQRLEFFTSLFEAFGVHWEGPTERRSEKLSEGHYLLTTGTFDAKSESELKAYLDHLGSRIVFLIDWNRMRKRLRGFVAKRRALEVLKWAADNDYGHRALLEIGGERALAEAVEYAVGKQLRYGQRLDELIGDDNAAEFVKGAMRLASLGLQQRRSRRIVHDEIKASLRRYFENERLGIFTTAAAHVAYGYDLAFGMREALERLGTSDGRAWVARLASRAVAWEQKADQLLNDAREDIKRFERPRSLLEFFEFADDAVDELEEAVALVELCALAPPSTAALEILHALADLSLMSAQEIVKCVECAASVTRSDVRDDLDEFLAALERLITIEHAADDKLRQVRRWLIQEEQIDPRQPMLLRELCQALEQATDAHAHAGQMLRAYLLEEVIA